MILLTTVVTDVNRPDTTEVTIVENNTVEAQLTVETAFTRGERYTGLSNHNTLPNRSGMMFIHDDEGQQTYVMRNMDFGLDIVFINNDCVVTEIHSARQPATGERGEEPKHQYTGTAKYVLEVPHGYTTQRITANDTVRIQHTQCNTGIT